MRFYSKPKPKVGDTKIDTIFLLFPLKIGNETRWLEWAKVLRKLKEEEFVVDCEYKQKFCYWKNIKFVD